MQYLKLFLIFLEIGTVSFGGGYGMISLIREKVMMHGWLTEGELLNFIAVAESTPGPIAVNMATFIGSSQGGFLGSICATAGVVLPSFILIIIVASLLKNLLKYKAVSGFLSGVRPCVVALILTTALTMFISKAFAFTSFGDTISFDLSALIIFTILVAASLLWKKIKKQNLSPILMILFSAVLGIVFYSR